MEGHLIQWIQEADMIKTSMVTINQMDHQAMVKVHQIQWVTWDMANHPNSIHPQINKDHL